MKFLIRSVVNLLVFVMDVLYQHRPYQRFWFLETIARVLLYPRAGTLGGCTVHSALFTVYPTGLTQNYEKTNRKGRVREACALAHRTRRNKSFTEFLRKSYPNNSDWDAIAENTGDPSWRAENMRKYFERLEQCRYVERPLGTDNPTRHGFDGWLTTEVTDPALFTSDSKIQQILLSAAREAGSKTVLDAFLRRELDPNSWAVNLRDTEGLYNIPQCTRNGQRRGPRELIRGEYLEILWKLLSLDCNQNRGIN